MTVPMTAPALAEEIEKVGSRIAQATAAYVTRLKDIVDISTLAPGTHDFDYAVTVSHADKPRILPLLSDLTFDIETEFGVTLRTLAMAAIAPSEGTGEFAGGPNVSPGRCTTR